MPLPIAMMPGSGSGGDALRLGLGSGGLCGTRSPPAPAPQSRRPSVLPGLSSRTLSHPSFYPLCLAMGSVPAHHRACVSDYPVPVMCPADFYYTDPGLPPGTRIHNTVSQLEVLEHCRLNTPAPVMSACQAPPAGPDPFRAAPYPSRPLGWPSRCPPRAMSGGSSVTMGSSKVEIIQLSEKEDQAVTSLLQLRYDGQISQHALPADPRVLARLHCALEDCGIPADSVPGSQRRSEAEMEAAEVGERGLGLGMGTGTGEGGRGARVDLSG